MFSTCRNNIRETVMQIETKLSSSPFLHPDRRGCSLQRWRLSQIDKPWSRKEHLVLSLTVGSLTFLLKGSEAEPCLLHSTPIWSRETFVLQLGTYALTHSFKRKLRPVCHSFRLGTFMELCCYGWLARQGCTMWHHQAWLSSNNCAPNVNEHLVTPLPVTLTKEVRQRDQEVINLSVKGQGRAASVRVSCSVPSSYKPQL